MSIQLYDLRDLESDRNHIDKDSVLTELANHGHPKSRIIGRNNEEKIQRTAEQARRELIDHYKFAHLLL